MSLQTVGLITYDYPHLKTEQILLRIIEKQYSYKMYALPFTPRKPREVLVQHRPDQAISVAPEILARKFDIPYFRCDSDQDIDNSCDVYLVLGAGILSPECIYGKKVINCHPGIIPACRGLDAFKWAILDMKPLGITLHFVDEAVDAGEIIAVLPTSVFQTDSLETLARRHYENEINVCSRFDEFLENPVNSYKDITIGNPRKRMSYEVEKSLSTALKQYVEQYG